MPELIDLLERRAVSYEPPDDLLTRVRERGQQRERNRRVGTGLLALVATVIAVGGVARVITRPDTPFIDPPATPLVGTWVSIDTDGSSQTMDIRPVGGVTFEMILHDAGASICAGVPATMTGTGALDGARLVIPTPVLTCDDGSEPVPMDGSSVEDAVSDFTLVHDAATDTLTDGMGILWWRPSAVPDAGTTEAPRSTEAPMRGTMWPQSSLDEVREAQELADAGDPRYTWQIAPEIVDQNGRPGNAEIFTRFLSERLGWESFRWGDHLPNQYYGGECPQECHSYRVAFARCGAGDNPLYPRERIHGDVSGATDGTTCAPTINEFTYETVTVAVEQLVRRGFAGIWVVTDSYPSSRMLQTEPPSDAQVAGVLDAFLQARVDGEGADELMDGAETDVPLLYATSNGARYDRFEYDLRGPMWPAGRST